MTPNLPPPTLIAPANGATGVVTQPTFSFSHVTRHVPHRTTLFPYTTLFRSDPSQAGSTPNNGFNTTVSQNATSYTATSALSGTYYWQVHALETTRYDT